MTGPCVWFPAGPPEVALGPVAAPPAPVAACDPPAPDDPALAAAPGAMF